ncbi:hypothetical protein BH23BAC1_BH23BAC1_11770 [soil metagenome]
MILTPLGVHSGEEGQVFLLLGKGFFMGIFIATYYTGANTLFLNTFDESYLSKAFIASGVLGVFSTYLFSRFQSILSFSHLIVLNLVLIAFIICGLRIGFLFTDSKWLIFLIFILNVPLSALTLLGFWGIVARMFNLRQAKRIIGSIDTGQLSAIILAFYATPLITKYIHDTINFFVISAISIIVSLIFLIIIVKKYNLEKKLDPEIALIKKPQIKLRRLYKNKYVVLLSVFLLFSMVAFVFVDFLFLSVTKAKYPEEIDLANFLGVFNGTIMIVCFLMQTFVNEKLISIYGIKSSLLILPVLLGIITIISIIAGYIFGYTYESASFLFFFLFISLSKLVTTSLRDALENPTIKLFFLPLNETTRFDIQTKVEGVINQLSILIAGCLIFLLGFLSFFELIHYSFFLLFIVAGWIYITGKIYQEYKNTLKNKLIEQKQKSGSFKKINNGSVNLLKEKLSNPNENESSILAYYKLLQKIAPDLQESSLITLLSHPASNVREFAYKEIINFKNTQTLEALKIQAEKEILPGIKDQAYKAIENLKETERVSLSKFQFFILVKASRPKDREFAARLLGKIEDQELKPFLLELLRDLNPEVRNAALTSAGKIKNAELLPILVENLSSPIFSNTAASALISFGEPILPYLDSVFNKTGQHPLIMNQIIKVIGEIGGKNAINLLKNKIDFPDNTIVYEILKALYKCKYQASNYEAARIKQLIESEIRNITWIIAALTEIPKSMSIDRNRLLKNALRDENIENFTYLYMLLSMLYDEQSIQLVKENIESRTSEGVTFAIELLDVFLDEDIKPILLTVLDEIPSEDKLERLQFHYPRDLYDQNEILLQIINQDYNTLNVWTKACAIFTYKNLPEAESCDELIAQLFNPELLIKESAAHALHHINKIEYHRHTQRLKPEEKIYLENIIGITDDDDENIKLLRFEKIIFLKGLSILKNISGAVLNDLLDFVDIVQFMEGDEVHVNGNEADSYCYLIYKGSVHIFKEGNYYTTLKEKAIIGDLIFFQEDQKNEKLIVAEKTYLFRINKNTFYNLVANNIILAENLIQLVSSIYQNEKIREKA